MRDWVHIAPMRWVLRHEMQPGQTAMEMPRRPRRGLYYDAPDVKRRRTGNKDKTHGCTNRLAWLQAMDPDAFGTLMTSYVSPHAVFRVVLRGIPYPARFMEAMEDHVTEGALQPSSCELAERVITRRGIERRAAAASRG